MPQPLQAQGLGQSILRRLDPPPLTGVSSSFPLAPRVSIAPPVPSPWVGALPLLPPPVPAPSLTWGCPLTSLPASAPAPAFLNLHSFSRGPAPGHASRPLSPRSLAGHPLSLHRQLPPPLADPSARLGTSCVPAILSRRAFDSCRPGGVCPLPPSRPEGEGPELSGVLGQWNPRSWCLAHADLSSHLPPVPVELRLQRGCQPGSAEGEWLRSYCQVVCGVGRSAD